MYTTHPPGQQQQRQPGREGPMRPSPVYDEEDYVGTGKLEGRVAIISGGDSGIGRSVAALYAKEGADVVIVYLEETKDARETRRIVEEKGRRCLAIAGDVGDESFCREVVNRAVDELGHVDIIVNNAAEQHPTQELEDIDAEQLESTFRTNIFSFFYLTKAALPHLKEGSRIINCGSVNSYVGSHHLIDYSSTKGAITGFTRALAKNLANRGIHVNAVAPGPIWTPLIPSTFPEEKVEGFGTQVPLQRPGQPVEVAKSFVFLASNDGSYMTGHTLHPDGGMYMTD